MKNKKGFTLTEVLLAVMIVGIIGVALAALTTAASRESGVGRSKVMLRNNLSIALRQLRRDVHESSRVLYVRGNTVSSSSTTPLLALAKNVNQDGNEYGADAASYITYCFVPGSTTKTSSDAKVRPDGAKDGGKIYRRETNSNPMSGGTPSCNTSSSDSKVWLNNVKYIGSGNYLVPLFQADGVSGTYSASSSLTNLGSVLRVNLITELPSNPVVNDVTEEIFVLPNGFRVE